MVARAPRRLSPEPQPDRHCVAVLGTAAGHRNAVGITHTEQRALRLERAREWQRQLDTGEIGSRSAIARREGLSRARVTQLMNLLGKRR